MKDTFVRSVLIVALVSISAGFYVQQRQIKTLATNLSLVVVKLDKITVTPDDIKRVEGRITGIELSLFNLEAKP